MNWKAARVSIGLSTFFMMVYGSLNWFTSIRHGVGSCYFQFERRIPFEPLFIVPYLSIDLFYVTAPFYCKTDEQLRVLVKRLVMGLLIGAICFAIYPLQFAFPRPRVDGLLGWSFGLFRDLDLPFNQLPSLHVVNIMLLAPVFLSRGGKLFKAFIAVWFTLIVVSTVFTYQHHIIDVIGGLILGALCFYLVPDSDEDAWAARPNLRAALYYFAGALLLIVLAMLLRPIGFILLLPATALLIAVAGYAGMGASIYRKCNGELPWSTCVLLWPLLLGQHLSLLHYRQRSHAWDQLTPKVWIGRKLSDAEAQQAIEQGVTSVLDLTCEFTEAAPFRTVNYLQLPILDLTAPTNEQLRRGIDFINAAKGIVYVHCKAGYSRTAAVAGAYLLASGQADGAAEAISMLRTARPAIIIRREALAVIGSCDVKIISRALQTASEC